MDIDEKYLTDWSGLRRGVPAIVHRPRSTAEVAGLVRACHARGQVMTVQGGLTGLAGGAVPGQGDVVINLERMDDIEEIDSLEGIMVVQAGATLQKVQQAAEDAGWHFAVDLGARGTCQVGGNAATNAGGERVLRYGTMRDNILGLEAVLPDGTVVDAMNRLVKNSAGPDLKHLFIGAEGTLGIITRLVLRLQVPPGRTAAALVDAAELPQVMQLLRHLRQNLGPLLSAFEFMSAEFVTLAQTLRGKAPLAGMDAPWKVLVEVSDIAGFDASQALQSCLMARLEAGDIANVLVAHSEQERQSFWAIRHAIPALVSHLGPTVNFDIGMPWKHMAGCIDTLSHRLRQQYPQATHLFFGHLGDNNLHLMTGPHPQDHDAVEQQVYGALAGLNATISAEHGIGFVKKPYLPLTRSPQSLAVIRQLKQCLDPAGLLNPGRIV